jgi:hypothetical protein
MFRAAEFRRLHLDLRVHVPANEVKIPVCTDQTKEIYQYAYTPGLYYEA